MTPAHFFLFAASAAGPADPRRVQSRRGLKQSVVRPIAGSHQCLCRLLDQCVASLFRGRSPTIVRSSLRLQALSLQSDTTFDPLGHWTIRSCAQIVRAMAAGIESGLHSTWLLGDLTPRTNYQSVARWAAGCQRRLREAERRADVATTVVFLGERDLRSCTCGAHDITSAANWTFTPCSRRTAAKS